jgi:hypothetical protein
MSAPAMAGAQEPAFPVPETLTFKLSWKGIDAGSSRLEVKRDGNDRLRMISTAKSVGWVSSFYTVDDRLESLVKLDTPWRAVNYHIKTLEGSHTKDREVFFYLDNTAQYINWEDYHLRYFELPREIYDPLSSIYHLRMLDLKPGRSASMKVFDSRKLIDATAEAVRREQVAVPAGTFDTIYIKFRTESEGAFGSRGGFDVWLSNDERHLPVKIRTKASIGHLDAELVKIER